MLTNFYEVARYVGLDPYVMLGRAGLHPNAISDPENWIPGIRILNLLRDCALRSERDDFSVLLGECRTFASLGPVSLPCCIYDTSWEFDRRPGESCCIVRFTKFMMDSGEQEKHAIGNLTCKEK